MIYHNPPQLLLEARAIPEFSGRTNEDLLSYIFDLQHQLSTIDALTAAISFTQKAQAKVFTLSLDGNFIGITAAVQLPEQNYPTGLRACCPWFLGKSLSSNKRSLVKHSQELIKILCKGYNFAFNLVGEWNKDSINWLKYCDFVVDKERVYKINGYRFFPFYKYL